MNNQKLKKTCSDCRTELILKNYYGLHQNCDIHFVVFTDDRDYRVVRSENSRFCTVFNPQEHNLYGVNTFAIIINTKIAIGKNLLEKIIQRARYRFGENWKLINLS